MLHYPWDWPFLLFTLSDDNYPSTKIYMKRVFFTIFNDKFIRNENRIPDVAKDKLGVAIIFHILKLLYTRHG